MGKKATEVTTKVDGENAAPVKLEPNALVMTGVVDFDRWVEVGEQLSLYNQATAWWIGDWYLAGEAAFGERAASARVIADGVEVSGGKLSARTVQEYAYICKKFPPSKRKEGLSFGHHVVVRAHPEAMKLLAKAERDALSVAKLKKLAKGEGEQSDPGRPCGVLYATPPWERGLDHVQSALAVWDLSGALVVMRCGPASLSMALEVLEVAGVRYRTHVAVVWPPFPCEPAAGVWTSFREDHALLLVGTGEQGSLIVNDVQSWLEVPTSEDPDAFTDEHAYQLVQGLVPDRGAKRVRMWAPTDRPTPADWIDGWEPA